jgi:hypothetical protein
MPFDQINWIAVAVGAVFSMVLGFLWYGPFFGKLWLRLIGKKAEEVQSSPVIYIVSFIAAFVSAFVVALVIEGFEITNFWLGLGAGAIVWVGLGAMATLNTGLFEERRLSLWLLFSFYQVILSAVEGGVFAVW